MTDIEPRRFRLYAWFGLLAFLALAAEWITGGQFSALLIGMVQA